MTRARRTALADHLQGTVGRSRPGEQVADLGRVGLLHEATLVEAGRLHSALPEDFELPPDPPPQDREPMLP